MANWNPTAPTLIGPEYLPTQRVGTPIATGGAFAVAQVIPSTVAQTVDTILAGMARADGAGSLVADVYAGASVPAVPARTARFYYPTQDVSRVNWTTFAGGTTNLWSAVDESPEAANTADGIYDVKSLTTDAVSFRLGTSAYPAARRVTMTRVRALCRGGDVEFSFVRGGTVYAPKRTGYNGVTGSTGFRLRVLEWGELCPWTGLPWTQTDMVELSDGTTTLRVRRADKATGYFVPSVAALQFQVLDVPENRVAYGVAALGSVASFAALTPPAGLGAAAAGWAKANATTYTIVLRPSNVAGTLVNASVWSTTGLDDLPPGAPAASTVILDGPDLVPTASTPGAPTSSLVVVLQVAGATSVDSNPWIGRSDTIDLTSTPNRQGFTPTATASYGVVRAVVKVPAGGSLTRLRFRIRRTSDNVVMGGEAQITREQALAGTSLGNGYYLAQAQLGAVAALVNGTAYYVEFDLVNGSDPWRVGLLYTSVGWTDQFPAATVNGGAGYAFGDALWQVQVAQLPATLAGTATVTSTVLPVLPPAAPDVTPCADDGIGVPSALVSWPATSLAGAFLAYEVQRSDERDHEWRTIARITASTTLQVYDHEVRLGGVASRYRVRQVRTDGIGSEWVTSAPVAFTAPPDCRAEMVWSSNLAPASTVIAPDVYGSKPSRTYKFQEAADLTLQAIYGRDGLVAFRPLERRGVTFDRDLLVDALVGTRPRGETVFDALRAICSDRTLPYVCVRDSYGDRWFAAVNVTDAAVTQPFDQHVASVTVTELTETPVVVTAWNGILGDPWVAVAGTWGTEGGKAKLVASDTSTGVQIAAIPTPYAESGAAKVVHDTSLGGASARAGLAVKVVDAQNYVAVVTTPGFAAAEFVKVVGGTRTNLSANWTGTGTSGFEIRWVGRSSTGGLIVAAFEGGVLKGSATITDPVFDGAHMAGLIFEGTPTAPTNRWEGFEAFSYTEAPGAPWVAVSGTWRTEGSTLSLFANDPAKPGQNLLVADSGLADAQVHYVIPTRADHLRLVIRYLDPQNYLFLSCSATFGAWTLSKRIAGVETTIQALTLVATGPDVVVQVWGDRLRVRLAGDWKNVGGTVQTVTLPGDCAILQAQTRHGIEVTTNRGAGDYLPRIASVQVDAMTQIGVGGAVVARGPGQSLGSHVDVIRALPTSPLGLGPSTLFAGVWGINDALIGSDPVKALRAWREGLRTVASRVLLNTWAEDTPGAGLTYYGAGWANVAATDRNSGAGMRRTSGAGDSFTIDTDGTAARGALVLSFLSSTNGVAGGVATIYLDAVPIGTIDTSLWTSEAYTTVLTYRVPRLTPGPHQIGVVVNSGTITFDGWGFEVGNDDQVPGIVLANVAEITLSPDYHNADRFGPSMIGDTDAAWTTDAYAGREVTIYAGTGAGQTRTVAGNTETEVYTTLPWTTVPDATSDFLVRHASFWGWITSDDVAAYNAALAEVAAEFPAGWVNIADMNAALGDDPRTFEGIGGGLHPNNLGHRATAAAIRDAAPARPWTRLVVAGHSYSVGGGATVNHGLDDVLRRLVLPTALADGFDRAPATRYRDSFDR